MVEHFRPSGVGTSEDPPRFTFSSSSGILPRVLPPGNTSCFILVCLLGRMDRSAVSASSPQSRTDTGNSREKFIAIGIDFGTTFSGVSWAFSEQADNIHEISEWPGANEINQQEVQVPTVFDIDSDKWGYQVTPDMKPVKWFKPLLLSYNDLAREENQEISQSKQLQDARTQLSKNRKITAIDLVGRYLKKLWDHTYAMLKTMMKIDDIPLRVAITVPANWPDHARKALRQAATLAGITAKGPNGAPILNLVREPEAATQSIMREHGLVDEIKPGDSFIVCDAGGGTVDVISYTADSNEPSLLLKKCVEGTGGLCGAVRIDEAFEAHLMGKNRLRLDTLSVPEYNNLVVEDWERGVKRSFTNEDIPAQFILRLPPKAKKTPDKLANRNQFSVNRWSAIARGAVIQLLPEHLPSQTSIRSKDTRPLPLPLPALVKRSRFRLAVKAHSARANPAFPNQGNRQEEDEPTEANTSVPDYNSQTVHQVDQAEAQQTMIAQKKIIDSLRKDLAKAKGESMITQIECYNLQQRVVARDFKAKETAPRSIEMPFQLPLQRPEREIVEAWHELAYDVANLVSNHFREVRRSRTVAWAKRQSEHLKSLTPDYMSVVTETKSSAAFIEAAIWNGLCLCIFGPYRTNAPFSWAGKYRGSLSTISNFLLADIDALQTNRHRQKVMFDQWKVLTANLVATLVPQERRDDEIAEITEDLNELLYGLTSLFTAMDLREELRPIVNKAVDLAACFCGQQRWYCVSWHPESCHEVDLVEERMQLMIGSSISKRVKFMVRPGLYGSRGEDSDSMCVLDRCRVWAV
ncbi:hypothetical protein MRS44_006796 [Fusarium solani]|uniref:uncharacterized protein n=1 Tax=Fusarium solani TaxID=169388 RepID=UPI0032C4601A|nr:hypothetical protein MRS44_006796 [Fusarium solani]